MTVRDRFLPAVVTLLVGIALGVVLATSAAVLAAHEGDGPEQALQDLRLLDEVMGRVKEQYVDTVSDHELMQHAIRGMVAALDPNSAFLDPPELAALMDISGGGYTGIGIEVSFEDGAIVVVDALEGSPAAKAGLRTGDIVVSVGGEPVKSIGLDEAMDRVRGEPGTFVSLGIEREGTPEPLHYVIERQRVEIHSVHRAMLAPGYGYLRISQFSNTTAKDVETAVASLRREAGGRLRGLVLDLRGNPGGVFEAGVAVADDFLDDGTIITGSGRTADARFHMLASPGDIAAGVPLVVLVDGGSASSAEIVAGALKDNGRATLIGRTTFGKGSIQTVVPLSGGQAIKLTTSRYHTPSGASIQGKGIEPDVRLERGDTARPEAGPQGDPAADAEVMTALRWLRQRRLRSAAATGKG